MGRNDLNERDVLELCSIRATRKVLRQYWNRDIPEDTVIEINELFNLILDSIAEGIVNSQIRQNDRFKRYSLRPKYRLTINKYFSDVLYKCSKYFRMGTTGKCNGNTDVSIRQVEEI